MTVVCLGIGAAKAGTSWLHAQLAAHPDCHFRAIKELHYFDALDGGRLGRERDKHRREQDAVYARIEASGGRPTDAQARRLGDRADWLDVLESDPKDEAAYLRYLQKGAGQARVVGEMTPAYALLSVNRLKQMATMAADVRMIFLMRDPVERLWSHVRMIAGRRDGNGQVTARRCGRILDRVISGEEDQIANRSDYAGALERISQAVPGGKYLLEVFEDVINGGFDRVCRFLGIAPMAANPVPVHQGQDLAMTADQRQRAAQWLAPQYDAVERTLGQMPAAWTRG